MWPPNSAGTPSSQLSVGKDTVSMCYIKIRKTHNDALLATEKKNAAVTFKKVSELYITLCQSSFLTRASKQQSFSVDSSFSPFLLFSISLWLFPSPNFY